MAVECEIDREAGVARLRHIGEWESSVWERAIHTLVRDPGFSPGMPVLVDVREQTTLPPPGEGGRAADDWRRLVPGSHVAIVAPPGGAAYGVVRQVSARSNGQVEAFTDPEEAVAWLRSQHDETSV